MTTYEDRLNRNAPKNYLCKTESSIIRAYNNKDLTNSEIADKISYELKCEDINRKMQKANCPKWILELDWNKILKTKLFNKTYL